MKNSKFFFLMCLFAMVLTGTVVLSTSCQRQPQHLRVEVSPEMGELVSMVSGQLIGGDSDTVVSVLQFENGFALYKGAEPNDSCLVQEYIGFKPEGTHLMNVAVPVNNCWIPVRLFYFSDSNIATETLTEGGQKYYVQFSFERGNVVELENIEGSVLFELDS